MKWLITGGCGFIGRNLIQYLLNDGTYQIRVLDNLSCGTREDLSQVCRFEEISPVDAETIDKESPDVSVSLIAADILDENIVMHAFRGVDVAVHLAANSGVDLSVKDPQTDCMSNVIGTLNCLEAARHNHVKRFVFASSGAPVGDCIPPVHEELVPHPVSPYGASKLSGEAYCSAYYRTFGLETVVLRFGNVYGPLSGHKNSVVAKFIKQALNGESLVIYGDGSQTRDFIFIEDLVRAVVLSAEALKVGGEIFQIATNRETTVGELVDKLLHVLAQYGYQNIYFEHAAPRPGDVLRNYSDTSKALEKLQWKTAVELSSGLVKTLRWFLQNHPDSCKA
jgi:UDP-glucose 4-epimerase